MLIVFFFSIPGINELHAFDNENMMIGNALEDANYQIAKDNDQMEELFGPVEEYYQQLDAEELEKEDAKKDKEWDSFVARAGGAQQFDAVDQVDALGSPKIVQQHRQKYEEKIERNEKTMQAAWDGIDDSMTEEEILLRMLGIVGDNEWNDDAFDVESSADLNWEEGERRLDGGIDGDCWNQEAKPGEGKRK